MEQHLLTLAGDKWELGGGIDVVGVVREWSMLAGSAPLSPNYVVLTMKRDKREL